MVKEEPINSKAETSQKTETKEQEIIKPEVQEVLLAEDKAVKNEIKKYSNTKVDFRKEKLEAIGNKE